MLLGLSHSCFFFLFALSGFPYHASASDSNKLLGGRKWRQSSSMHHPPIHPNLDKDNVPPLSVVAAQALELISEPDDTTTAAFLSEC
jgi:hypothetical protein